MYCVLERIEGEYAVLIFDNKNSVNVLKAELADAKIGDVFYSEDGNSFTFDEVETKKRKQKAVFLHRSLFDKAKKE